jgi:5-methylcytosine-specific restriction endonuclease McrA
LAAKVKYQWVPERDKAGYTELSVTGIYANKKWVDLRNYKLQINPLCEHCEKEGLITPAVLVDHKIPVHDINDPLMYDFENLQSLCETCHRRKTRKDNSKYSDKNKAKGKDLMNFFET